MVTLYHGDCRDVLSSIGVVDAVVTDPPYGINAARRRNSERWGWRDFPVNGWDARRVDADLLRLCVAAGKHAIIWGGNYFYDALPYVARAKWLIWDKGQTDFSLADCELAWCSWEGAIRRITVPRSAALQDGRSHPTQKSLDVMQWSIAQLPKPPSVVLDPFAGSGTTLVAAKALGVRAVGVEAEEAYCAACVERLSQNVLDLGGAA